MLSRILPSAALAMMIALPSYAATWFDRIEVGVDLNQITSPEAAQRYANVSEDLTNVIAEQLAVAYPDQTDGGAKITVDLDEVALAAPFGSAPGATSTAAMAGTVSVENQGSSGSQRKFNLAVSMDQVMPYVPQNQDVTMAAPSTDAVYEALLKTFAAAVVDNLDS